MKTIQRGALNPISLAHVAKAAGVSISTVSRIVNGETARASATTIERVQKAVEALGYRPNHLGRALRRRESRVVAMLAANLDNPVMAAIAASTEAALREAGYVMILCDTHDRADLQDDYLQAMRSQAVQGYVLVSSVASPGLQEFVALDAPIVFVSRRNPCGSGAYVGIDNLKAGADAADYLWAQGVTEPGVLYPTQGSSVTRDRVAGFCHRLKSLGVPEKRIRHADAPGLSHLEVGYSAARQLGQSMSWPKGIMCVSDQIAYGAFRYAHEQRIHIPDDCRIVGIDNSALNAWLAPWLTSIHIPYQDFGREIVGLLVNLWAGGQPQERILPHHIMPPLEKIES